MLINIDEKDRKHRGASCHGAFSNDSEVVFTLNYVEFRPFGLHEKRQNEKGSCGFSD
jgi:hypothetical protein